MPSLDDTERMRAIQGGDHAAFEAFVRDHERRFYRIALGYLADPDEALDAAQEAFVRVWHKRRSYRPESTPETWAQRILANLCIDRLRRRRLRAGPSLEEIEERSGSPPADARARDPYVETRRREDRARVARAVLRLPERMRLTLVMRFAQDLKLQEIARLQGRSLGTVKATLHRALRRLRVEMAAPDEETFAEGC